MQFAYLLFFSSVFPSQQGVHFARQKEWEKR